MSEAAHLQSLITGASEMMAAGGLRNRRLAAFQIIDFYELTFREARECLGHTTHPDNLGPLCNSVLSEISALHNVTFLKGLFKFRNALAHDALQDPLGLEAFVEKAEVARGEILRGAADVARRRASVSDIARRLEDVANELLFVGPIWDASKMVDWKPLIDEALAVGRANPAAIEISHVDLLIQLREQLAVLNHQVESAKTWSQEDVSEEEDPYYGEPDDDDEEVEPEPNGDEEPVYVQEAGDYGAGHDYDKPPGDEPESEWRDDPDK